MKENVQYAHTMASVSHKENLWIKKEEKKTKSEKKPSQARHDRTANQYQIRKFKPYFISINNNKHN